MLVLVVLWVCFACSNNDTKNTVCGVINPIEELDWLQKIKSSLEKSESASKKKILQYNLQNTTYFLVDACVGCPDYLVSVYNCSGEIICESGGIDGRNTCPDFTDSKTEKQLLWEN